ncbi:MAG: hypothetical protein GY930_06700 [bacterium]|nr:hypothetical protein [bacterium]
MHRWQTPIVGAALVGLATLLALTLRTALHPAGEGAREPAVIHDGGWVRSSEVAEINAPTLELQREGIEEVVEEFEDDFKMVDEGLGWSRSDPEPVKPSPRTLEVEVVTGTDSTPVPASIKLLRIDAERGWLTKVKASVKGHGAGAYTVTFPADSQPEWVVADGGDAGVGSLKWEDAAVANEKGHAARVTVHGGGRIAGRVVDASGDAVVGLRLCAIQVGSNRETLFQAAEYSARLQHLVEGAGRGYASFYTDEEGRFEVGGLREVSFVITCGIALQEYLTSQEPLGRVVANPDPVPVVLHLSESQIIVRVATPTPVGSPAANEPAGRDKWSSIQIDVHDLGPIGGEVATAGSRPSWKPRPQKGIIGNYSARFVDGRYLFHMGAEAGRRYAVRAWQDKRSTPIQTVEVGGAGRQAIVDLTIPEKPVTARLQVDINFAHVKDEHPDIGNVARVWLEDPETGIALRARTASATDQKGALLEAAPGPVRVVVEGVHAQPLPEWIMTARRRHGRTSTVVEVTPGSDIQLELALPAGGAVRVAATGADSIPESTLNRMTFKIQLQAEGSDQPEELKRLFKREDGGYSETNYWSLGTDMVSERLPAGRYTVTTRWGTWTAAPQTIEIQSGSVVELKLHLE